VSKAMPNIPHVASKHAKASHPNAPSIK